MTIRVALVIPTMDLGGAEKQLCLLATHLPRKEFDVHVILLTRDGPRGASLRQAGVPVTLIDKRFKADPTALWRLRRVLKELAPDVVHTWIFAANSFGRVAARMAGVPRILASERCVDSWKTAAHFWIDRRLATFTETITTNSVGVRDFYAEHGIDRELFEVIPNGIPARLPGAIDREEACRRLDVSPERKIILAVGRLWPQKRYRDLIWAAELLAAMRQRHDVGDYRRRATKRRIDASSRRGDNAASRAFRRHVEMTWPTCSSMRTCFGSVAKTRDKAMQFDRSDAVRRPGGCQRYRRES